MNRFTISILVVMSLLLLGVSLLAGCSKAPAPGVPSAMMMPAAAPGAPADAAAASDTVTCPVLGTKGDKSKMIPYEYQDKTYYFCCQPCVDKFKQDPEKYLKEGTQAAISAACPVSGRAKPADAICPLHDTSKSAALEAI